MRCVEAWSMVIPWIGFPLARAGEAVRADSAARSTSPFRRCCDPTQMPGQRTATVLDWPYVEGLRMDEAHAPADPPRRRPLRQACCPTRTARRCAWWCRGSTASRASSAIVKIRFVGARAADDLEPWPAPSEYGFYANVNPAVDHPRWSQATRAAHRRVLPAQDAALQRLRRRGRLALRRHGPEEAVLSPWPRRAASPSPG